MPLDYEPFNIEIEPAESGYIVRLEYAGAEREGLIPKDLPLLQPQEIAQAQAWLERGFIDREYARDFGSRLFQTLFPAPLNEFYWEAARRASQTGGLRLILELPLPAELERLPWELLYDAEGGYGFLARSTQTPLVRYFCDLPISQRSAGEGPLRVLVVLASPSDKPPVSSAQETQALSQIVAKNRLDLLETVQLGLNHVISKRTLRGLAERLRQRSLVTLRVLEHATRRKLQECLMENRSAGKPFHVVHFVGHGQAGEQSLLVLEAEDGRADPIPAEEFAELIAEPTTSLVVLNACQTAAASEVFQNTAREILKRRVPSVIGMQVPVMDRAAVEFARSFYGAWAAGEPIEAALAYARRLISQESPGAAADWSIPVLYLGPTDGPLLQLETPALQTPLPLKILRWALAAVFFLLGAVFLLLQVPNIARSVRTELPGIRCTWPYPMPEQPSFNIAVVEFNLVDANGRSLRGDEGVALASYMAKRLEGGFGELNLPVAYAIRPPEQTCPIEGNTREAREQAAAELAEKIGAHILIYGKIVKDGSRTEFSPEFYVNPQWLLQTQEVTGEYELGKPLRLPEPLQLDELALSNNLAFSARSNALVLITIGLAQYSTDNYRDALSTFQKAEALPGWLPNAGKEVIYLMLGNTSLRIAAKEIRTISGEEHAQLVGQAQGYYTKAKDSDLEYARAWVGLGNTLYIRAQGNPRDPNRQLDLEKLSEAEQHFQRALQATNAPASANISAKVSFGTGQVHLVRGQFLLQQASQAESGGDAQAAADARQQAETGFKLGDEAFAQVIAEYQAGKLALLDLASQAAASRGGIAYLRQDYPTAIPHIQQAIQYATPYYKARYSAFLGDVYRQSGQLELARQAYEDAIQYAELAGDAATVERVMQVLNEMGE